MKKEPVKTDWEKFIREWIKGTDINPVDTERLISMGWFWFEERFSQVEQKARESERQDNISRVKERMEIEKHRSKLVTSEEHYIKGKYIGLRYAVELLSQSQKKEV